MLPAGAAGQRACMRARVGAGAFRYGMRARLVWREMVQIEWLEAVSWLGVEVHTIGTCMQLTRHQAELRAAFRPSPRMRRRGCGGLHHLHPASPRCMHAGKSWRVTRTRRPREHRCRCAAPASAIIMLGFPCRCSSRTQDLARLNESGLVISYTIIAAAAPLRCARRHAAGDVTHRTSSSGTGWCRGALR